MPLPLLFSSPRSSGLEEGHHLSGTSLPCSTRTERLSPLPRSSSRRRIGLDSANLLPRCWKDQPPWPWSHGKCTFLGAWATSHWRHDTCGFFLWNLLNIFDYICMIIILILDNIYICNMHIIDYNSNNTGKPRRRRHVRTSKNTVFCGTKCTCPGSWLSSCNAQLSYLCVECYNNIQQQHHHQHHHHQHHPNTLFDLPNWM